MKPCSNEKSAKSHRMPVSSMALALAAVALLPSPVSLAAGPDQASQKGKSAAVTLEAVPGTTVKRVTLTPKAAERLGIQTAAVGEQPIVRRQVVGGLIMPPSEEAPPSPPPSPQQFKDSFAFLRGAAAAANSSAPREQSGTQVQPGTDLVQVANRKAVKSAQTPDGEAALALITLSQAEWERLAKDKPARILLTSSTGKVERELEAFPLARPPVEDARRSMLTVYYGVPEKNHGLAWRSRVRVELQMAGDGNRRKVVPYGAIYYDGKGIPWVYVNTAPLTYVRQRVNVEHVVNGLAVLSEGPPLGTPIVSVGAAMLYGAEIFGK